MNKPKIQLFPTNQVLMKVGVEAGQVGPIGPIGLTPEISVKDTITGGPEEFANVSLEFKNNNLQFPELTFTIPRGLPFVIAAEYSSVSDLLLNVNPTPEGYIPKLFDLAIVTTDVEDPENARLFIFDENQREGKGGWTFVSDLSGATGPMRGIRWRPNGPNGTTSILEWQKNDGTWEETSARNLALQFKFEVDENNELILEITNPDGVVDSINLTSTAEFGNGTNATITSIRFKDNNDNLTSFQELGVYGSWVNTELTITNPDSQTFSQELALDFNWDDTKLGVKNPTAQNFDYKKLSPDILFQRDNGLFLSIVEPDKEAVFEKISPDIQFKNEGNGLELSIHEPEGVTNFQKVSPDIVWDGVKLAVIEPDTNPKIEDYINLGVTAEFGASGNRETVLTLSSEVSSTEQELGVYASFGGHNLTETTLVLTNPDETTVNQELGIYGSFGGVNLTPTTLTIFNPDSTAIEQELGIYASFENTELIITNPDEILIKKELGLNAIFSLNENETPTTLVVTNPNGTVITQELGVYGTWGEDPETKTILTIENPNGSVDSRDLALEFVWGDGNIAPETALGVKRAEDSNFIYVDLKGETGDLSISGVPVFKIRDEVDNEEEGFTVTTSEEIRFIGDEGIEVIRDGKDFFFRLIEVDGGDFPVSEPEE